MSDIFVRKYRERVDKSLITEEEYKKILDSLKKDYKVISNRFC